MYDITVYRVLQFMSKKTNVICVDGVLICTAREKSQQTKLSGYDISACDRRINKLSERLLRKEE